jgi:site-specific recombinase XerD
MMTTDLGSAVSTYLRGRVGRGELDPMTARNHRSTLNGLADHYGPHPVENLKRRHIERWMETRGHLKPSTRRAQVGMVRTFCGWLERERLVLHDPSVGLARIRQPRTVPRALPSDAIAKLIRSAPDSRARAIIGLQVWSGLRCGEVARLNVEDWNRRDHLLRLVGKGGHEREVPLPEECARLVDVYLAEYPATVGPLIRSYRQPSNALAADTISGMVSEWMRAAGVKRAPRDGIAAHALRHTAASDVLDACGDVRVVQSLLGHKNLSTTAIYLRRADLPRMREAMRGRSYRG